MTTRSLPRAQVLVLVLALALTPTTALASAQVGAAAPDFTLPDATGKTHALSALAGKIVVIEWVNCNCPFIKRHTQEKTMVELAAKYPDVVWLSINSTNEENGQYTAPAEAVRWSKDNGIEFPMLFDSDGRVGQLYGAQTTPHMFVIGKDGKILYNGAIDDDPRGSKSAAERTNYVDLAVAAAHADKPVEVASTKPYGCSVKY